MTETLTTTVSEELKKFYFKNFRRRGKSLKTLELIKECYNDQYDFFITRNLKNSKINDVYEQINKKWSDKIQIASAAGIKKEWKMKSENKSKNYTTNWNELCKAFAN